MATLPCWGWENAQYRLLLDVNYEAVFLNSFHNILDMGALLQLEGFVWHTPQSRDPRFPQEAILAERKQFWDLRNFFQLLMQRVAGSHAYASLSHGFLHPTPTSPSDPACLPAWEGLLPKGQASLHPEEYLEKPIRQTIPHTNPTFWEGAINFRLQVEWKAFGNLSFTISVTLCGGNLLQRNLESDKSKKPVQ